MTHEEREKQVAIAFANYKGQRHLYVTPCERVWGDFIKHESYLSIPEADEWIPISDKGIEFMACEEMQQDWNRLEYAKIYKDAFIEGAKYARDEMMKPKTK